MTRIFSRTFFLRSLLFFLCAIFPFPVFSQDTSGLSRLVFDPVAIHVDSSTGTVTALSKLPSSESNSQSQDIQEPLFVSTTPVTLALDVAQYEQSIKALEDAKGPYEPDLSQELMALANAYQQLGNFELALTTYNRSNHIRRLNHGLFTLEQEPIIRKKIEIYMLRGDLTAAKEQQQYLLDIQARAYGSASPELIPAYIEYAIWNLTTVELLTSEVLNSYSASFPNYFELGLFVHTSLTSAYNAYQAVTQILIENYALNDSRLLDIEYNLAMINYYYVEIFGRRSNQDATDNFVSSFGYAEGRKSLQKRIGYLTELDNTAPDELARSLIALADWHLIFNRRGSATTTYEQAYQALLSRNVPTPRINELLYSQLPVAIPEFAQVNFSRAVLSIPEEKVLDYKGYIDIQFSINTRGLSEKFQILDQTESTTDAIMTSLMFRLKATLYRPRILAGASVSHAYQIRYYYSY